MQLLSVRNVRPKKLGGDNDEKNLDNRVTVLANTGIGLCEGGSKGERYVFSYPRKEKREKFYRSTGKQD